MLKLTCWKNLTEIVIKSEDVVNCMKYIHFMMSASPSPFQVEGPGNFRLIYKGGPENICYFRGGFKGVGVNLKDTMHLKNISFSL